MAKTLKEILKVQQDTALTTEDLIHMLLPLIKSVAAIHAGGRVAQLGPDEIFETDEGTLALSSLGGVPRTTSEAQLRIIQPHAGTALKIVGEYRVTVDDEQGRKVEDLQTAAEAEHGITKPVFLAGYRCWEKEIGHHDELTDIFATGQIFASLACGLNLDDAEDVEQLSRHRTNLFRLNRRLHPVLATLIMEMTALNRHERATDMGSLARRLETYRDQPVGLAIERVLTETQGAPKRRTAVLSHLRDRLFDLSRRNRLVYFRPTQASVNLTVASVPVVTRLESIRGDQLCTWGGSFANDILSGKQVPLSKWLRFEDQPYLPSALDRIIQEARRDKAEYGFSNLRLVIAFLHWHNLKEAPDERITSPLLWLPVEVAKTKGVRDHYTLRCTSTESEFNPALRHCLRQLYDIKLPDTVDLSETQITDIHRDLEAQIHRTEPGVNVALQSKPVIQLVHQKAVQRLRQFQRRRGAKKTNAEMSRPDFSYESDDYRPLGLALFEKHVRPSPLPQRLAVGASMPPRQTYMAEPANTAEALTYSLGGVDRHRFSWEIDLTQVTTANFNYKKMSLVRDYNQLIDTATEQPSFDRVFSIEPRAFDNEASPALPLREQWSVGPADNTQNRAIALARTGKSFIIQGPPGTGKSQTITNLIADFAARGKRVLFVCEKRAALDVVFHRLKQARLDRLACLVHDSQEDKKEFVLDLKDCYERWGKNDPQLHHEWARRQRTIDALIRHVGVIESFERAMSTVTVGNADAVRKLVRRLIALPEVPDDVSPKVRERLPAPRAWDAQRDLANRVTHFMSQRFGQPSLAGHPFALLAASIVASDQCYTGIERFIANAQQRLDVLDAELEAPDTLLKGNTVLADGLMRAGIAKSASECGLARNLDTLDPTSSASLELNRLNAKIESADAAHAESAQAAEHWRSPLSRDDTIAALHQAERLEGSFFKFLNGGWRKLKRTVRERYDFSAHAVTPTVTSVLEKLAALHAAEDQRAAERRAVADGLGITDMDGFITIRRQLAEQTVLKPSIRTMVEAARASGDPATFVLRQARPLVALEALAALLRAHIDFADDMQIDEIATKLRDLQESLDDLPEFLPLLRSVHAGDPNVGAVLRTLELHPDFMEAVIVDEAVKRAMRAEPALKSFDTAQLACASRRAAKANVFLRDENASVISATLHSSFRDHVKRSTTSVTQLDSDGKRFKKRYSTGRRELEHEFGKSMRFKSIRELAGGDTGAVVNDLKPIWLMSPLSVSDTLPLEPDLFDVVVFDEASQIPTEEAIPALCRAAQVIVVGDEMQLPPTSFFSTAIEEDDMQIIAEEEGEKIAIILDADSLLSQAARNLPATMLAWHYRSRSEALISFSNAAFYDGRLVTIPDQSVIKAESAEISVRSEDVRAAKAGAARVLQRPITFHHVSDGFYEKRANAPEACYIAHMVRDLLFEETGLSVGIVAFSEAQQTEIESALEQLAAGDSSFAARLEQEYVREDDGQFNGLFVKNLENVQGDERDIMILSICYAPGRDGRMAMNFGPINQRGGEKRLNVIFSRAKHHMALVSTIYPEAITNTHNDGARALRTFLSFAQAQSAGAGEHAQAVLATVNPNAERVFLRNQSTDPLRHAIAEQLRLRGHEVHEDVGSAAFRCDLAVVDPESGNYALAVLLDGGKRDTVDQVIERFVFQPGILKAFGWRVIDIPSTDWLKDGNAVIEAIEAALTGNGDQDGDDDPYDSLPPPLPTVPVSVSRTKPAVEKAAGEAGSAKFNEFHFTEGSSNKFWKVAVSGCEMIVIFGRIGTKGSTVTKVFESEDRAKREANKLVLEKTRKGYVEIS
jgi:predicted DNA-binding WGR domain protein